MNNSTAIAILISLTIISAFFSASETSMMALNRYRLKHMVKKGNTAAKRVYNLLSRPDKLLNIMLIGNTFANLLFSSIFTQLAIVNFGELSILESLLLTVVSSLIVMIFAESTPKTLAALHPQLIAFPCSRPLKFLLVVLYPLVWFTTLVGNTILRIFGIKIPKHHKQHDPLSHEELRTLVHESSEHFPASNSKMLIRLLDLNYTTVEDAMIPRNEIQAININNDWRDLQLQILNWPYSQILFYKDDINNILGFVHIKSVISLLSKQQLNKENILANLEECYFIPESTTLAKQLLNFQNSLRKSGLVVDEYGEIMGLISLQDILEEVVGDFAQENETTESEINIQKDGSVLIEGCTSIRDINRELNWHLPEDGPKTLSGLIIENLEHIPDNPTGLVINNYKMEILKIQKNTIKIVKVYA